MITLDDRSLLIFKELLVSPRIKGKDLEKKLNLTRRQINYSIQKINDWLADNSLPIIENQRNVGFIVDRSIIERVPELLQIRPALEYIPTKKERMNLLLLMILARREELSLFHLASALKVSKNTVLHDLHLMEKKLKERQLALKYTRRDGYFIEGKEIAKRKLIVDTVNKILHMPEGWKWINAITGITEEDLNRLKRKLEVVEKRLNKRFTDQQLNTLAVIFLILLQRMKDGKHPEPFDISYVDISNTKEYQAVEDLFGNDEKLTEQDRLYIALHLLSSSVVSTEMDQVNFKEKLYGAIERFVANFEKVACVNFQSKHTLYQKLYQHLKPAFYRVTYELSVENPLLDLIKQEYGDIHHLVKQSIGPLEKFFSAPIPEDELAYLTLLIKSSLQQQGDDLLKKPKAIVVCPSGISVSKLVFEELKQMFPDIIFLDHISVRDFPAFEPDYDIVFSTVFLNTKKKLFLIPPVFTDQEKQNLKIAVEQELKKKSPALINYDRLMNIIEKHASVKNPASLKEELKSFFYHTQFPDENYGEDYKPNLIDLVPVEFIRLQQPARDWKEAILLASRPLLQNSIIEMSYIDAMIRVIQEYGTYMIAPKVVIPHAKPEDGAHKLCMSVLTLKNAVRFPKNIFIQVLIVIAAVDRKSHIKALTQLYDLLMDKNNVETMIGTDNPMVIHRLFREYSTH